MRPTAFLDWLCRAGVLASALAFGCALTPDEQRVRGYQQVREILEKPADEVPPYWQGVFIGIRDAVAEEEIRREIDELERIIEEHRSRRGPARIEYRVGRGEVP